MNDRSGHTKAGFTLGEYLFVVVIFLVTVLVLTPAVALVKERVRSISCTNNLREISLALHTYAADHKEQFPATLGELYPAYIKDPKVFHCPASKAAGVLEKPDYAYRAGMSEASPPGEVVVSDLTGDHRKGGKHLLRLNGTIELAGKGE